MKAVTYNRRTRTANFNLIAFSRKLKAGTLTTEERRLYRATFGAEPEELHKNPPEVGHTVGETQKVPSTTPGELYAFYGIQCGMCKTARLNGINNAGNSGQEFGPFARDKATASRILRENLWAFTRQWGWICPRCREHGSSGVIPGEQV